MKQQQIEERILARIDSNFEDSIERLCALLRFPSISTDPAYASSCKDCARWLEAKLKEIGFSVKFCETKGHPIIWACHEGPAEDSIHVIFYGHYDVQPVDPIELWTHSPFTPVRTEKTIIARGASDDKGQLMTFIEACRAFKEEVGQLPLKVTILLEGEEESGSENLAPFLEEHAKDLQADYALICDTTMWDEDTAAITVGLRGILSQEIIIQAANKDLHSGVYGGAAANPLLILSRVLGQLHDTQGRITIEDFYQNVENVPQDVLAMWKNLDCKAEDFLGPVGLKKIYGEKNRHLLELLWARPTAEINGISGGYTGEGFKTVIPSIARAKVSFRLVKGQDPEKIREKFQEFVRTRVPEDCSVRFIDYGGAVAAQVPYDAPVLARARLALEREWKKDAVFIASGGSIPVVSDLEKYLQIPSLLIGFALDEDNIHSPNEKYNIKSYHKGQRSWARILCSLTEKI